MRWTDYCEELVDQCTSELKLFFIFDLTDDGKLIEDLVNKFLIPAKVDVIHFKNRDQETDPIFKTNLIDNLT